MPMVNTSLAQHWSFFLSLSLETHQFNYCIKWWCGIVMFEKWSAVGAGHQSPKKNPTECEPTATTTAISQKEESVKCDTVTARLTLFNQGFPARTHLALFRNYLQRWRDVRSPTRFSSLSFEEINELKNISFNIKDCVIQKSTLICFLFTSDSGGFFLSRWPVNLPVSFVYF